MLVGGIKLSSRVNQIVVAIKLAVVALVIVVGITYIDTANYTPFIPPSEPTGGAEGGFWKTPLISSIFGLEPAVFGVAGVIAGAAIVFFAFIGFDVVATTAEETRNPQKNVPIGILGSLAIVTVLYIAVCLVDHRHAGLPRHRPQRPGAPRDRLRQRSASSGSATSSPSAPPSA